MVKKKQKQKANTILQEQLNKSFDFIPQSNVEQLKEGMLKSLEQTMDVSKEPPEILVGVGSGNDLDLSALEDLGMIYDEIDAWRFEHRLQCNICKEDDYCQEYEDMADSEENRWMIYSDGKIVEHEEDGSYEVVKDTLTIFFDADSNDFQVIKSPVIEEHGLCSLCFPNQADLNSEGTHRCYALPEEYKNK